MPSLELGAGEVSAHANAMATEITVRVAGDFTGRRRDECALAVERALRVFGDVEDSCTRFDPASPLMRANERPDKWHQLPLLCFDAVVEAWRAYEMTGGRFDPRVLEDLVALGYDRSLPFAEGAVTVDAPIPKRRLSRPRWNPRFRRARGEVCLGGFPIDLGGIGKGLGVRWASAALRRAAPDFVVDAGGDCYCAGLAPEGGPWRVGVEDPTGGPGPVLVVALSDQAAATSSIRVRRWNADGVPVHHLIDPRSGLPGGQGLLAVTVVGPDPALAEVWSKVLFLAGSAGVASQAAHHSVAACWVTQDGTTGVSAAMEAFVEWRGA